MEKSLNKEEKFVCEIIWGGIPVDTVFVRNSKFFQESYRMFREREKIKVWKELYDVRKKV